ncbi:carbohydrate kinase family protein [bacterium]|nr:carbohydrate kinase family protein [bacterium]
MRIAGAGCSLADFLYSDVDYESPAFQRYRSRLPGDGGLEPGRLVFLDEFERFSRQDYRHVLRSLVDDRQPDAFNIGGPSIVALILAAQLLADRGVKPEYYGVMGDDDIGRRLWSLIERTPLNIDHYNTRPGTTPFTLVLSDPNYAGGQGERSFINNIGVSGEYGPEDLPDSFFDSDIVLCGATALVPRLHDNLTALLEKAKQRGCVTVVSTVYDFRSEKRNPGRKWPLGDSDAAFQHTDLFIADREEALRISGTESIPAAGEYLRQQGVSAYAITHGAAPVTYFSDGRLFEPCAVAEMPVCQSVGETLCSDPALKGDTTGCGDNFVGGMLATLAMQMQEKPKGDLSMNQAVAGGIVAGGCACFHLGGVMFENTPGEKAEQIRSMYDRFREQIGTGRRLAERMV